MPDTLTSTGGPARSAADGYDIEAVRKDFPVLERTVGDHPLVYLDSANTSQKPRQVIEAITDFYAHHNANVARAMHLLGAEATAAYEGARAKIAGFLGAADPREVIYTKNASEALNLAANTLGSRLGPGDEVVVSVMEHHSNLVPWQLVCQRTGATLRWFDVTEEGRLDLAKAEAEGLVNEHTKVVAITRQSNVLGTINPVTTVARMAHAVGAVLVIDASQSVPQLTTDVQAWEADLVAFTGHKMLGPTGLGVLWGRYDLLEQLPPFLGGGEMIEVVRMEGSTYAPPPYRFEAGTPPIAETVMLAAAIDYLNGIGMDHIAAHEQRITDLALKRLADVKGLRILGPTEAVDRGGAISFTLEGVHPHDVMTMLDARGVAVRGGHHCARPLHDRFGIQSSTRASFYLYTTEQEIEALAEALDHTRDFFDRPRSASRTRHREAGAAARTRRGDSRVAPQARLVEEQE